MAKPDDLSEVPSALRVILEALIEAAREGDDLRAERVKELGLAAAVAQSELNSLQRAAFRLSRYVIDDVQPLLETLKTVPADPAHKVRKRVLRQLEDYLGLRMALDESIAKLEENVREMLEEPERPEPETLPEGVLSFPRR